MSLDTAEAAHSQGGLAFSADREAAVPKWVENNSCLCPRRRGCR